jgi:anti-anti-sigma factor
MDSSGIAVALHTMQQMKQLGGKMRIGYPSAQVKKVFTAAGLQQLIELEEGHEK